MTEAPENDVRESPFVLQINGTEIHGFRYYRLSRSRTIVGRSNVGMPDLVIFDDLAAPRHCALEWDEEMECHKLRSLGINGLYLNDQLIGDNRGLQTLEDSDVIRIGNTMLIYTRDAPGFRA